MTEQTKITSTMVLDALRTVMDPELGKDLVTLNMIKDIMVNGATVKFAISLTSSACPLKKEITAKAKEAVSAIPGVEEVYVEAAAEVPASKKLPDKTVIPNIRNTIAIASGKGGVGKSSVTVNLALALAKSGSRVGILDIDIYGPSIPMMMGIKGTLLTTPEEKLIPLSNYGIEVISVGFILEEGTALIWRGPLVMQLVKQFLLGVEWGELDYLVIDLPPGTGDAQLTLVQTISLSGAVIVTTPQDVALLDAHRAIKMFHNVKVPIIGLVENMSSFKCPHCGEKTDIFSQGGGDRTSKKYDVELLGKLPLDPIIREGSDTGKPVVISDPSSTLTMEFEKIAGKVASKISTLNLRK